MPEGNTAACADNATEPDARAKLEVQDRTGTSCDVPSRDEHWLTVLGSTCTFPPDIFNAVMLNLIKNPNITSSHLFRADVLYDTGDTMLVESDHADPTATQNLARHLKPERRPRPTTIPGYERQRTIVRELVPRNPQLDTPLVQTCHFFRDLEETHERNMIVYVPHVENEAQMPFYHPAVKKLAFAHDWTQSASGVTGYVSISYLPFDITSPNASLSTKLHRTALRLLQTVHKHGQGQLAGYEKRVHHDQIVPQKRYQDTYSRLKATYGRHLAETWVEVTDPGKHVFEDLGIAAFLIELWRDMYRLPKPEPQTQDQNSPEAHDRPPFPGFVDIGCGNGLLVYILLSEGYPGWGFDARERKTWSVFPAEIRAKLKQQVLVPSILQHNDPARPNTLGADETSTTAWNDGRFAKGTFIVSNHADELTPWTPILAAINEAAFVAIPCCSHDLSGARFRARPITKGIKTQLQSTTDVQARQRFESMRLDQGAARLPQQEQAISAPSSLTPTAPPDSSRAQAAETGSLRRTEAQKKMPSAYATLCSYVASLSEEVGFVVEKEVLRIPSTRNQCIIGRKRQNNVPADDQPKLTMSELATELVERELGTDITTVSDAWLARVQTLSQKPGSGH